MVEFVVVMSGWAYARLQDCRQPYVAIRDRTTGHSLCEYHLEDKKGELAGMKAVVMCRCGSAARMLSEIAARTQCWTTTFVADLLNKVAASSCFSL